MENSSKALLITAAVLIVILLIAFSVKIFNSPQEVQQQSVDVGMSISREMDDATEDLSSSFDINREIISGEITSNPNDEIQDATTSVTNWHIKTVEELKKFANLVNSGNKFEGITVYLDENLDLKNEAWTPIGNNTTPFMGTFEGQNHYIERINVDSEKSFAGLFGYANKIKDLEVKNSTIKSKKSYVGGIAGVVSYIDNCISQENTISGRKYVGGIAGSSFTDSQIINCKNESEVQTILSAEDIDENIKEYGCHTGGIIGYIGAGTTISGCVNLGVVKSNRGRIGGIVGDTSTSNVTITNCANKGDISLESFDGTETYVGGIVGVIPTDKGDPPSDFNESNRNTVSYCYNEGDIEGPTLVGGITGGIAQYMSLIEKCYNTGEISGNKTVGGICGSMGRSSQIINCYNRGEVKAKGKVKLEGEVKADIDEKCGGILAYTYRSANTNGGVINCYNLGKINDKENSTTSNKRITPQTKQVYVAGILGYNENETKLLNCLTDKDEIKSNFVNNAGNNVWEINSGINEGYPVLIGMN